MSENRDQHWACSVCDAGGHPLTMAQAHSGGRAHMETTGHFTVWGKVRAA